MAVDNRRQPEGNHKGGLLCAISSPSGGGKTSVIGTLLKRNPDFNYSISATTRPKRKGEEEGVDYYFISEKEFNDQISRDGFIEWAEVHGFQYGTLKGPVEQLLAAGQVVLLDIDVIGGMNVRRAFPDRSLLIFLSPVNITELEERLRKRNSESADEIRKRLKRLPMEMSYVGDYDLEIINDDFAETVKNIEEAIHNYQASLEA